MNYSQNNTYYSDIFTEEFQHIAKTPGIKPITQILTIDDGTGKLYTYELTKDLTWIEYNIEPNFSTNPTEPTILDSTEIIPSIVDSFDVVGYKYKDEFHLDNTNDILDDILPVDYNFYYDGLQLEKSEDETINQVLSTPRFQDITQDVRYFTGWDVKTSSITKNIKKTNLPPVMCNSLDKSCYTVPVHTFITCSTDYEDVDPSTLITNWKLYIDRNSYVEINDGVKTIVYDENNPSWELIHSIDNSFTLYWVYSEEGRYKINQVTTDTDGATNSLDRYENITFEMCGSDPIESGVCLASGSIEVNPDRWQLIAIPMEYGYWDSIQHKFVNDGITRSTIYNSVIKQIEDRYARPASELFKVANAYIGSINQSYNYIPGFTKEESVHNFNLVYLDEDMETDTTVKKEITGFWIKCYSTPFKIDWELIST